MNVQLRNSNGYPGHVLNSFGSRRRRGFGATPGYTPAQQAMADAFAAQFGGSGGATFVQPTVVPPPSCINDTGPGGAAYSPECQALLNAANQQTMANRTAANYNVDLADCNSAWAENDARYASMGLPRPVNDCAQRTFGLTLPGTTGGTNIDIPNAAALLGAPAAANPAAAALAAEAALSAYADMNAAANKRLADAMASHTTAPSSTSTTPPATSPTTTPQKVSDMLTGGSKTSTPNTPSDNATLYWVAGLAAAGLLIYAAVNR